MTGGERATGGGVQGCFHVFLRRQALEGEHVHLQELGDADAHVPLQTLRVGRWKSLVGIKGCDFLAVTTREARRGETWGEVQRDGKGTTVGVQNGPVCDHLVCVCKTIGENRRQTRCKSSSPRASQSQISRSKTSYARVFGNSIR